MDWINHQPRASLALAAWISLAGYHLRHALAPISESSLSRVDFWHALMDPSHGSPQDLLRTLEISGESRSKRDSPSLGIG